MKRAVAAYLWIAAAWSLGAVAHELMGVTEYVGLVLGVVAAAIVLVMPAAVWNRQLVRRTHIIEPSAALEMPRGGLVTETP